MKSDILSFKQPIAKSKKKNIERQPIKPPIGKFIPHSKIRKFASFVQRTQSLCGDLSLPFQPASSVDSVRFDSKQAALSHQICIVCNPGCCCCCIHAGARGVQKKSGFTLGERKNDSRKSHFVASDCKRATTITILAYFTEKEEAIFFLVVAWKTVVLEANLGGIREGESFFDWKRHSLVWYWWRRFQIFHLRKSFNKFSTKQIS